jgi:AAA+ ATPase superfamily predicted ATPase
MSQLIFVDRKEELAILRKDYAEKGKSLFVIYGRRRVGKTELIRRFTDGKGLYFLATNEGDRENIRSFQGIMAAFLRDPGIRGGLYSDWFSFFSMLSANKTFQERYRKSKLVVAFDEFPYLIEANKSIPSVFQKIYDTFPDEAGVMLILSGSSISMMENEILSYRSPLYGRRTGQLQLNPLKFRQIKDLIPLGFEDLCRTYFVLGGVPDYLLKFDQNLSFWDNVFEKILSKGAPLYEEAEFLLRTELREPRNYMLILKSIAKGNNKLGEISDYTGLDKSMVSKYMDVMMSLELISPEIPFGAPEKFKRRLYRITDPYLKFWLRYVLPNRSEIEISRSHDVLERIKEDFGTFSGEQFEQLMRELVVDGIIGRPFSKASRWWGRNRAKSPGKDMEEIDIVAYSAERDELLFAECKWSGRRTSVDIIHRLKEKSKAVIKQRPNSRISYAVFSKSGFSGNIGATDTDTLLMDIEDLRKSLEKMKK